MGYTVWKYFKKPVEGTPEDAGSIRDRYPLYAFTKEKLLHKDFEEQRDMSKFVVSKNEMEEEEYKDFANQNVNCLLEYMDYVRKGKTKKDGTITLDSIQILSNRSEHEFVEDMKDIMIMNELSTREQQFHPLIFKKKYLKALKDLQFVGFWIFSPNASRFFSLLTEEESSDLEYADLDIEYDEVNIFMYLYSDTFIVNS